MGHEEESERGSHGLKDSAAREGSKSREHRDEKYSRQGEDHYLERKKDRLNEGKGGSTAKESYKKEEKEHRHRENVDAERSKSRKDGGHVDARIRVSAHYRDRHRHRDKACRYEGDSLDTFDEEADSEKHVDGSKEGRCRDERVRDSAHNRDRHRYRDKASKHELEVNSEKHVDGSMEGRNTNSDKHLDGLKEGRHGNALVRDSANDRGGHRHRDKAAKYEVDLLDTFEEANRGKHSDGFKENSKGRVGEKARDVNDDKYFNKGTDRHHHRSDKDSNNETDRRHHCSGHTDTRKESAVDDMQEKHERTERVQKRKDYDDTIKKDSEAGDRHSKRRRDSVHSGKPILDGKDKAETRKRDNHDAQANITAGTALDVDEKINSQSRDKGDQVSSTNLDANGLSSVLNEPLVSTMGFQHVVPSVTEVASHLTGPIPPVPSKVPTLASLPTDLKKGEPSTQDFSPVSSKSGAGVSSEGVKTSSISLDALMKAKKALQMQKELSEKLKKLPQLNKAVTEPPRPLTPSAAPPIAVSGATTASMLSAPGGQNSSTMAVSTSSTVTGGTMGFVSGVMPGMPGVLPNLGTISNYEAVKRAQEYVVRLGFQQPPGSMPLLGVVPPHGSFEAGIASQPKTVKAPVLRLDAHGREIDEHGNIMDRPKVANVSTLKVNINKQKKDAFQILHPELDEDPVSNPFFDPRMGIDRKKLVRPRRSSFQFVEEGKWSKEAEILRLNSQFGEAKAKEIKAKQAVLAKAKAEADINPNLIEVVERFPIKEKPSRDLIPDVEWWDAVLLPSGSYKDVTEGELKVRMEKLTIYVEHPVPIEPPAEPLPPPPQPLKLTKKEQKKLRTQRRLAKEKERQEMIRQGLLEPPKSKVKMSNLMKVLGAEATQDPTRLEQEIRSAAAEREQAHTDRNLARKLTPAERREKKEKKLFDDPSTLETIVCVFRVSDLSHPQSRFKVDVNAQENRLTGCVVMCDALSVVIVEGGSKSIKRYSKLMLKRINWAAVIKEEDQGEEARPHQINKCSLVWQGSVAKTAFNKFLIQQCRTEVAARKFLADAGVAHYWDLAVNFSEE
ncbi:hypothetical protein O6H91_16G054600 [Diphasiastrum complanatum]|uniref:Uncharacterized protein n=1 Tax=Diphasiastrum complanatum TaxID=34168 RepID=A0ACC2BCE2_DIPCM|nr:hypothetical protein O6H91_16G054600 [Diphasiastrum complanatum]